MRVDLVAADGGIAVYCPYSPRFTDFAHMRKGVWSDQQKCWLFDKRDEFAIRQTLVDIYGTDNFAACAKCDVRVSLNEFNTKVTRLFFCGREIARRRYADRYVDLGEGVVVVSGGFPDEGQHINARENTVLEVRDVPVLAAERLKTKYPDGVVILGGFGLEQLYAERDYLRARLAKLDVAIERLVTPEEEIIADLVDEPDAAPADCGR